MNTSQTQIVSALKAKPLTDDEIKEQRKVWDKLDVKIEYVGRVITLPAEPSEMPLDKAIEHLQRMQKDLDQPYQVHEIFDAYPHDAAVAFTKALQQLYGWVSFETDVIKTFFGDIKEPPTMLSIKTGIGANDVVQCPMGKIRLPGVKDTIKTQFWRRAPKDPVVFLVHGEIKKKDRHIVLELTTLARQILKTESIYLGKPLRLKVGEAGELDTNDPPDFLDVREMTEEKLLFDDHIQTQIDTNVLVPLKKTEACRLHNIPLKRTVLLEGPFGTGKSLLARLVARIAELNGWTFILLDRVQGLKVALEFANRYAPAVVFAEDIDRIASERTDAMNDLINVIDGVLSKKSEIMTVLTTNFMEKLDPVILRPGRLDAVISIKPPGPKTVERLLKFYAGALLHENEDLSGSGEILQGQIPASIREAVERAKLGMIGRGDVKLTDSDVVTAGQTMKTHLDALNKDKAPESDADALARSLSSIVNGNGTLKTLAEQVSDLHDNM